jgi:hypothetical protein
MPTTTVRLNASADTLHPDVQGCVHMQNNDVSPLVVLDYLIHIVHSFPSFLPHSLTPAKPIHEMTTRYPSSCLQAVSCLKRTQHGPSSTTTKTTHLAFTTALLLSTPQHRPAQQRQPRAPSAQIQHPTSRSNTNKIVFQIPPQPSAHNTPSASRPAHPRRRILPRLLIPHRPRLRHFLQRRPQECLAQSQRRFRAEEADCSGSQCAETGSC